MKNDWNAACTSLRNKIDSVNVERLRVLLTKMRGVKFSVESAEGANAIATVGELLENAANSFPQKTGDPELAELVDDVVTPSKT